MPSIRNSAAPAVLSFVSDMAFSTPSVSAATCGEITPAAATWLAANEVTALIAEVITEVGTPAEAAFCDSTAANVPPDTARP